MPFGREPLLNKKQEETFKEKLISLREQRFSAKQIAEKLNFGKAGPYKKLTADHVYFYITKFNLKRKIKKRQKVQEKQQKFIDPRFPHRYHRWTPDMPDCVVDGLRRGGYLLNDPLNNE